MKTVNAIKFIERELGVTPEIHHENKVGKSMIARYKGHNLTFFDTKNGDAECIYVVRKGLDNGYNGYNGVFPGSLSQAVQLLKMS